MVPLFRGLCAAAVFRIPRFHDHEGFTTRWSMKVFAIMEIPAGKAR
jgi:hypothetical protein